MVADGIVGLRPSLAAGGSGRVQGCRAAGGLVGCRGAAGLKEGCRCRYPIKTSEQFCNIIIVLKSLGKFDNR